MGLFIQGKPGDPVGKTSNLIHMGTYVDTENEFACDVLLDVDDYPHPSLMPWWVQFGAGYGIWVERDGSLSGSMREVEECKHNERYIKAAVAWAVQQPVFFDVTGG